MALALLFYGGIAGGVLHHRARRAERRDAEHLPVRLDHHDLARRRVGHRGAGRGRAWWSRVGLAPQLFAVAQDEEFAQVAGAPRHALYNMLVSVMAAVTVTVAMRTVGLLLVSALMVVPVADRRSS